MKNKKDYSAIFEKQFDNIADDYGTLHPLPSYFEEFIINNIPKNQKKFLEVGCGTGQLLESMSNYFIKVYSVDFSKKMIENAKKKINGKATFIHSPIENTNLDSEKFDYIVCNTLFHHLSKDREKLNKALENISETLRPGGRLIISDYVIYNWLKKYNHTLHDIYKIYNSIIKGKINLLKEFRNESKEFRMHLKTERGMFFSKKEFYDIFRKKFKDAKISHFGKRRKIITHYYLIWDKK